MDARIERRVAAARRVGGERTGTTAAASASSAAKRPSSASAVEICVPLSSASPSFGARRKGASPAAAKPSLAGMTRPSRLTAPTPMSTAARWASGARSPEAPTEPLLGMTG
jgi:hypothetical protein